MTLLERRTMEAEETRERAQVVGLLRRDEHPPADRYEWPDVLPAEAWRRVRETKIPVGDGRMV